MKVRAFGQAPARQANVDGRVEVQPPRLGQAHRAQGGEGLGQGLDAEQGIFRHGDAAFGIGHAERTGPHRLAVAQEHDDGPGDAIGLDPGRCRFRQAGPQGGCAVLRRDGGCNQGEHGHHGQGRVAEPGNRGHPAFPCPVMRPGQWSSPIAMYH